jgi:hypothetical protein
MNRKQLLLLIFLSLTMLGCATGQSSAAQTDASKQPPQRLKVAFAVTERFNLLDVAGAWEVGRLRLARTSKSSAVSGFTGLFLIASRERTFSELAFSPA